MASLAINRLTTFPAYRSRFLSQDVVLSSPFPAVADRVVTDVVVTATGLNSIYAVTIPANVLRSTGRLSVDLFGTFVSAVADQLRFTIQLGGTTIFTNVRNLQTVADNPLPLHIDLIAEAATSSFAYGSSRVTGESEILSYGTSTQDLTTDLVFEIFAGWDVATPGRVYTMKYADALLYFPTDT